MILPTVDEKQIVSEILLDYKEVFRYSILHDRSISAKFATSKTFPVFNELEYTSRRKNKWLLMYEARSKKEVHEQMRITFVCLYRDEQGRDCACMPTFFRGDIHYYFYAPHFFDRYSQRYGTDKFGVPLIKLYFRRNNNYGILYSDRPIDEENCLQEVYGSSRDGVAIGLRTADSNALFKTFITYKMTLGDQVEAFARSEQGRKEIND